MDYEKSKKLIDKGNEDNWHQLDIDYQGEYEKFNYVGATSAEVSIGKKKKLSIQDIIEIFLEIHCQLYDDNYLLFNKDGSHYENTEYSHFSPSDFKTKYTKIKDGHLIIEVYEIGKAGYKGESIFATIKYKSLK